jgi:hypothetical protein
MDLVADTSKNVNVEFGIIEGVSTINPEISKNHSRCDSAIVMVKRDISSAKFSSHGVPILKYPRKNALSAKLRGDANRGGAQDESFAEREKLRKFYANIGGNLESKRGSNAQSYAPLGRARDRSDSFDRKHGRVLENYRNRPSINNNQRVGALVSSRNNLYK